MIQKINSGINFKGSAKINQKRYVAECIHALPGKDNQKNLIKGLNNIVETLQTSSPSEDEYCVHFYHTQSESETGDERIGILITRKMPDTSKDCNICQCEARAKEFDPTPYIVRFNNTSAGLAIVKLFSRVNKEIEGYFTKNHDLVEEQKEIDKIYDKLA